MKKTILFFIFFLSSFQFVCAQEKIYTLDEIYTYPEFIGPDKSLMKFVGANFIMPEEASVTGVLEISFIIEPSGKVSNVKVVKDLGGGTGAEAVRVMQSSPRWVPGKLMDGTPVKVLYILPITLKGQS